MSDFIKETWDNQASTYKNSHWASWGDNFAIELEIDNIANFIKDNNEVLDVGCANGFSTFEQLKRHSIKIKGLDFSEKMIEFANDHKSELKKGEEIEFKVGDIRNIEYPDQTFDVTYTTRVLINLPTWEEQIIVIKECLRVTKNNGIVILSEAFWEPLMLLNSIRIIKNLPSLVEHDFNRYIKKEKLEKFLTINKISFNVVDFSSIYYLGSRFLREFVTEVDKYPGYSNPINKIFYDIEKEFSGGGFGIQQAYILHKIQ